MVNLQGKPLKGIVTALVSPFHNDRGDLKEEVYRAMIDYQIEKGIHGLFILGTGGEGPKLPVEKRKKIAAVAIDQVNGRIPVIVHVGSYWTYASIELAKHAEDIGADRYAPDAGTAVAAAKKLLNIT